MLLPMMLLSLLYPCSAQRECEYFLSTPAQLAVKRRKVEKEKEKLEQQMERVSPGM
jgi:hypothetical protein